MSPGSEWGLPPLRTYWRQVNRHERLAQAETRAKRKATDKKRAKCRCPAYPWPHRPGGGLCRWPDPPVECDRRSQRVWRPYRKRYAGILRQIARRNGLHPIRDRKLIEALMPHVLAYARQIKAQYPRVKYRNVEIVEATATRVRDARPLDERGPDDVGARSRPR